MKVEQCNQAAFLLAMEEEGRRGEEAAREKGGGLGMRSQAGFDLSRKVL